MKTIIYQLLPRLFGNEKENNKPNGDLRDNGCGKLNDITLKALAEIKAMGATHVWYTGLLEHATQTDYSANGIKRDHRAMVKGKAGSPYAVKDYYDIDPDLASQPERRFKEFQNLVARTHRAGLKMVMDFVPNHVAREYCSDNCPQGVEDLGATDDKSKAFAPQNNFYYIPNAPLQCQFDMKGEENAPFLEMPAKATGNNVFGPSPSRDDWYETVKLNYGIDYTGGGSPHFDPIPSTWKKMLGILLFWSRQGVDAFRCDMAEMVPCEFWNWAVSQVKAQFPEILFIGEVYNPSLYRNYLQYGLFDLLYDKVGLYDTLRAVTCGQKPASSITACWQSVEDIQEKMLNFLENHDEQRIASDFFAGNGEKGKAALVVSACMNRNPFMFYFGQELGERGMDAEGFSGADGRTTIYDYWSVESIRKWRNKGKFDGKGLTKESAGLRNFYAQILQLAQKDKAINDGLFFDLMYANNQQEGFNADKTFAFIRSKGKERLFITVNFSAASVEQSVCVPLHAFDFLKMPQGDFKGKEILTNKPVNIHLKADEAFSTIVPAFSASIIKVSI